MFIFQNIIIIQNRNQYFNNGYNQSSLGIDPAEFSRFMQQTNNQARPTQKYESLLNINKGKVQNKNEYANLLRQQIEEKEALKKLQSSPGRNYYKVTSYHPSVIEQMLSMQKQVEGNQLGYQNSIQASMQPPYLPRNMLQNPPFYGAPNTDSQNAINKDNQDYPKNVRGMFKKEMYSTQDQMNQQELKQNIYRQELIQQMDEKRMIKKAQKERDDQEDMNYMERMKKQQEELGVKDFDNDRKISSLRIQKYQELSMEPILGGKQPDQNRFQHYQNNLQQDQQQQNFKTKQPEPYQGQIFYQQPSYNPIIISKPTDDQPQSQEFERIEELKFRLQEITNQQNEIIDNQYNYAQTRVDLDVMKQHYSHQQSLFDRDMDQLRVQLTRADQGRLAAEKELLYLQDKAKEKRIWDIVSYEQDSQMPNLSEQTNIFKTAKYAYGNLSEADRRQQILKQYYQQDKSKLALGPLGRDKYQQQQSDFYGQQLEAVTDMILGGGAINKESSLNAQSIQDPLQQEEEQIQTIKKHDENIQMYVNNKTRDYKNIQNSEEYKEMLEQNSLVQVMQLMRMKGDNKVITPNQPTQNEIFEPLCDKQELEQRIKSSGKIVIVTFIDDLQEIQNQNNIENPDNNDEDQIGEDQQDPMNQTKQSSVYEFSRNQAKTDDLLEETQMNDIPKVQFGWETELEQIEEIDPLDNQISGIIDNIKEIVNKKGQNDDYYKIQAQLKQAGNYSRNQTIQSNGTQQIPHWKPLNFVKSQLKNTEQQPSKPVKLEAQKVKDQTEQIRIQNDQNDPFDKLDDLLKNFTQQQ